MKTQTNREELYRERKAIDNLLKSELGYDLFDIVMCSKYYHIIVIDGLEHANFTGTKDSLEKSYREYLSELLTLDSAFLSRLRAYLKVKANKSNFQNDKVAIGAIVSIITQYLDKRINSDLTFTYI